MTKQLLLLALLALSLLHSTTVRAFVVRTPNRTPTQLGCICINCKWVTSCTSYHFVEEKHSQPHMTENPTFTPRDGSPTIQANVRTIRSDEDRKAEAQRMWREHEDETRKAREAAIARGESGEEGTLVGEKAYNLGPLVAYELDVVACEDFVEDQGAWVRNMPEEIKKANPHFVPS